MPSLPSLTAVCSATFTCAGSTHNAVITTGVTNPSSSTPASINTSWRGLLVGTGGPYIPGIVSTDWSLVETKVIAQIGSLTYTDVNPTVTAGGAVVAPVPMNSAVLVYKATGISGRAYRGRMFAPPASLAEGNVSAAGIMTGGANTTLLAAWQVVYNGLISAGYRPCIIHLASGTWTLCSNWGVNSKLGTMKRRLRG